MVKVPNNRTNELIERTFSFTISILKRVEKSDQRKWQDIHRQIIRSCTSVGANYEEAQAAESYRDFSHKVGIVCKECRETKYWLRVIKEIEGWKECDEFIQECHELLSIFSTIKKNTDLKKHSIGR